MSFVRTIAPSVEPITLAEAKLHLRVSGSAEDTLITMLIGAARRMCEARTERALITQTWEATLDAWPDADGGVELARPPVQSVAQVQYVPSGGTALVDLAGAAWTLDSISDSRAGWLLPVGNWPATADVANAVRVQFVTGYGAAGTAVPEDLRAWLLLAIGTLYAQRESIDSTGKAGELPGRFWDSLLDPYRNYSF